MVDGCAASNEEVVEEEWEGFVEKTVEAVEKIWWEEACCVG